VQGDAVGLVGQLDDGTRPSATVDPASLRLQELRVRGRAVWAQTDVPAQRIEWAVAGWEVADALRTTHAGVGAPREPMALYLFADSENFRRLTSQLTGLPLNAIRAFEGGRSFTAGARRGIYVNAAPLRSAAQAARVVAHELVHLAERDALATRTVPRWFSEGLAEYVAQFAMAHVDAHAAAERRWRRAAVVASALHLKLAIPLSALTTPQQWNDQAAAGYDRVIYAEALQAIDWLVTLGGPGAAGRVLTEVARGREFAPALEAVTGIVLPTLDASADAALRADLLPRYPVGIHVFEETLPPGARFQFAAVGLPPGEMLSRHFTRDDGYEAHDPGPPAPVGPTGAAFWTFQTRPDTIPAAWMVAVEGNQGTLLQHSFHVTAASSAVSDP
jgi:hypothetical protein